MEMLIALIAATAILVAIPGPNVALIVANTIRYGYQYGALTVLGTTFGIAVQLALVVVGLAAILSVAANAMMWVKWLGITYLLYLGIKAWCAPADDLGAVCASTRSSSTLFWEGFAFAIINPKTLIFNMAFLPQFVPAGGGHGLLVLAAGVYLAVLFLGDLLWVSFANAARPMINKFSTLRNKLTGGFYVGAGLGLSLAKFER